MSDGSKLGVQDEDFLVASLIERCPRSMMSRELVTNAIEAAMTAAPNHRLVRIGALDVGGVPKLCIWNTGAGLDAEELFRMCDIASSIGKEKGLQRNFGMGAKVAALPSNQHGMRYRSCRRGRVHEIVIGKRDGVYMRLPQRQPGPGILGVVANVTAAAWREGRELSQDWTEVVLLGNHPAQNTVLDPYGGDPPSASDWLSNEMYRRYFRLPEGCVVELMDGAPKQGRATRFATLGQRAATDFERYECVDLIDGRRLHYFYDPADTSNRWVNRSGYGALQEAKSMAGVIHRDEIYALEYSGDWTRQAPNFGITFGARQISVFVELPDDYPLVLDGYRQTLRHRAGLQPVVALRDFTDAVRAHRPAWLIELMKSLSPHLAVGQGMREELQGLMLELGLRPRTGPRKEAAARSAGEATSGAAPTAAPEPAGPAAPAEEASVAPDLFFLDEEIELSERQMQGRAARYYPESHQLYINLCYPALGRIEQGLLARLAQAGIAEVGDEMRGMVKEEAERLITRRVGHAVAHALAKELPGAEWPDWAIKSAVSPEALSIVADDFQALLPEASEALRRRSAGSCGADPAAPGPPPPQRS